MGWRRFAVRCNLEFELYGACSRVPLVRISLRDSLAGVFDGCGALWC